MANLLFRLKLICKSNGACANKMDEKQLNKIRIYRSDAFKLDIPILIAIMIGFGFSAISPILSGIFGMVAFGMFYKKLMKAAHEPCPRCEHPFGAGMKFPLGVGTNRCQNCGLSIDER